MPHARATTSIEHRAGNPYRKNPSVWPHCLGEKKYKAGQEACGIATGPGIVIKISLRGVKNNYMLFNWLDLLAG